ncbi:MAG: hypothetical protein ABI585_10415 [Betaproteobacteria bacterium]
MTHPIPAPVRLLVALASLAVAAFAAAQGEAPRAIDVPRWFATSFLDFRDEVADAARATASA